MTLLPERPDFLVEHNGGEADAVFIHIEAWGSKGGEDFTARTCVDNGSVPRRASRLHHHLEKVCCRKIGLPLDHNSIVE